MSVRATIGAEASTAARYEALVRVSEALAAYRERGALFRGLARELRPVIRFSFLGLALYDERTRRVTPHVLEATGEAGTPPDLSELAAEDQLTFWSFSISSRWSSRRWRARRAFRRKWPTSSLRASRRSARCR